MCDQTTIDYLDGDVVWVKLGKCWWPGEVVGPDKLPPDVLSSFRKPPIAVVKFFQENTYEYVKNINLIYKYNCSRKNEFINKGLYMFRAKNGRMEKFPEDVVRAETAIGGDKEILSRDEFQEVKKESYAGLFGDTPKKTPGTGRGVRGRPLAESANLTTPIRKFYKEKSDYKVHILLQGSKEPQRQSTESISTPSTSRAGSEPAEDKPQKVAEPTATDTTPTVSRPTVSTPTVSTPTVSSSGIYACHSCSFSTSRLNVLILHNKTHSVSYTPYTPTIIRKKTAKPSQKSTPTTSKTPKVPKTPRPRKEISEKPKKSSQAKKRSAEEKADSVEAKKPKTEQEIKSSLLADWEDADDDSNDTSSAIVMSESPEVPVGAESPAVPTPAELPAEEVPVELSSHIEKISEDLTCSDKPESSSDSKYDFCEDDDWHVEADAGRKIPRVKNPSKRKEETKSLSVDDDDMAKEVAELLTKTTVPELPSVPEPLKVEENFPEPPVVKSPDKNTDNSSEQKPPETTLEAKPTKAIFKTKTFFRSRHSRSQDVIGKYVAEQLNAAERMDLSETDINGSEAISSPEEPRQSPPVEHPKVARLAPKIQLKKQFREKERIGFEPFLEDPIVTKDKDTATNSDSVLTRKIELAQEQENTDRPATKSLQDVLYPTQEIKPINKGLPDKLLHKEDNRGFGDDIFEKIDNGIDKKPNMVAETVNESDRKKDLLTLLDASQKQSKVQSSILDEAQETIKQLSNEDPKGISVPSENFSESELQESHEHAIEVSPIEMSHESNLLEVYEQSIEVTPVKKFYKSPQKVIVQQSDISTEKLHKISPQKISPQKLCDKQTEISQEKFNISPQKSIENQSVISSTIFHISPQKLTDKQIVLSPEKFHKLSPKKSYDKLNEVSPEISHLNPQKSDEHCDISHERFHVSPQHSNNKQNIVVLEKIPFTSPQKSCDKESLPDKFHKTSLQCSNDQHSVFLKSFHKTSQQNEISPPIETNFNFNKPIEKSLDKSALKQSIEASPLKSNQSKEITLPVKFPEPNLQKSHEQLIQPYMSDSTASAVDALLSVSRETDRVPRIVSDDLPEDLFEDDNKDVTNNDVDGINPDTDNGIYVDQEIVQEEVSAEDNEFNVITEQEVAHDDVNQNVLPQAQVVPKEADACDNVVTETTTETTPSESDLQIAEALINLPSTAIQNKASSDSQETLTVPMCLDNEELVEEVIAVDETVVEDDKVYETKENDTDNGVELPSDSLVLPQTDNLNVRYETEQEKCENLNAAQSLVQMSETIDHQLNIVETKEVSKDTKKKQNNGLDGNSTIEQKVALLSSENNSDLVGGKSPKFETTSSKLLKILEEPSIVKPSVNKTAPVKHIIVSGNETILNIDVAKSPLKGKPTPKQKIIIRRAPTNKNIINSFSDVSPDNIILSRKNTAQDGSSIQTFTIQASPEPHISTEAKQFVIQPKIRRIPKPSRLRNMKPQNSLITQLKETKTSNDTTAAEEPIFDINSMPVVLSDDILTPESIEKMPIVMSDGNLLTNTSSTPNPPKLVKTKPTIIDNEKVVLSPVPSKPEVKTLLMNTTTADVNKVTTPNILSKSSKLRGGKPMLVIDKATGKQKIIMTKGEPIVKEMKQTPTLIQSAPPSAAKAEKFIILPTSNSPRAGRTQKIVIDPQTGKAHVLVAKGQDTPSSAPDNKPVSAKLIPSSSDASTPGNTVMIITNAQGAQSRIVLTPEHEKILFPNKQQPNVSQLKAITHRLSTNTGVLQKTIVSAPAPVKTQTRIVPRQQKSAIITSKGQLIVGGRIATTAQNIAPMPEIRSAPPRRIIASEPKKLVQAIQKNTSEPLIFLQQKSGAVMQLTAAQFEHLQRTGQIVQKSTPTIQENKIVVQKSVTISPKETIVPTIQKQRIRKLVTESPTPAKKVKQEITIAPAPVLTAPVPPLTSLSSPAPTPTISISTIIPSVSNTVSVATTPSYPDLDNFEELLPSTAIARQNEPAAPPIVRHSEPVAAALLPELAATPPAPVAPVAEVPNANLSDGQQLLAVPGENFGGPPGSFYLCVEDSGTFTAIDNRPLMLENNQLVPMTIEPVPVPVFAPQPERRDILEAALANSDVFHADSARDDAPDFRDLNANVSVHCRVSETSTTLNQPPIMTPVEIPSKCDSEPAVTTNLEDGLAVIGVTPHTVPTSLELPITVTDPRIALKTTDPLSNSNYGPTLLPSPNTEMSYVSAAGSVGPISMPLLTDEEAVGKSMPILTDEAGERTASSADSAAGSPASLDVRESEPEEGAAGGWGRRLLTPGSDTSEASAEIPLQPAIQLFVNELSRHS